MIYPLVYDDDKYLVYYLEIKESHNHCIMVDVTRGTGWDPENNHAVVDTEEVLHAYIKWDGCVHINFKDNGYQYLAGQGDIEMFNEMMEKLYKFGCQYIPNFDEDEKWKDK